MVQCPGQLQASARAANSITACHIQSWRWKDTFTISLSSLREADQSSGFAEDLGTFTTFSKKKKKTTNQKLYPRDDITGQVRLAVLALIFVSDAGAKRLQKCRVLGCECIPENREIWDPQLFPHSLTESTGLGSVGGMVTWEQFLSAKMGTGYLQGQGKGEPGRKAVPSPFCQLTPLGLRVR